MYTFRLSGQRVAHPEGLPWTVLFVLVCLAVVSGCSTPQKRLVARAEPVSLIKLLATPERYNGRFVSVMGFYHGEFEGYGLYLSREDAEFKILQNGLWVGETSEDVDKDLVDLSINDCVVRVEGLFEYREGGVGHFDLWPGEIHQITFFRRASRRDLEGSETSSPRESHVHGPSQ